MLPSTLKYLYSVEPVRMHFPAKQPCTNDTVCKQHCTQYHLYRSTVSFIQIHQLQVQQASRGCQCSFRLLMIGGVSPETCWASYKYGINNFDTFLHFVGIFSLWNVLWCTDPRTSSYCYEMYHYSCQIYIGPSLYHNMFPQSIFTCICLRRRLFRVTLEISRGVINLAYRDIVTLQRGHCPLLMRTRYVCTCVGAVRGMGGE
jgi:hypothetical protein